jgi:hypothetical protein
MSQTTKSRYPGIRAFEKNERHVFFGRRTEAKKLYNLVKAKPLVVLFAKSGIGKSSLINAGLEPLLENDYYKIIKIRLQTTSISSVDMVKNELQPFINTEKLAAHSEGEPGFWEMLRACEFKRNNESLTPVLVFDQFEEFFEHDQADQDALTSELADMVSERLPERIRESLRSIPFRKRTAEELEWHSPIPVKIVFAIRSDRISLMDEMSSKIPSILHNRFHLKPLGIKAAKEAIVEPADAEGDDFDTPSFTYDPTALQIMLDYLKNRNDEIESFQLQLLCRNIERTVQRKGQAGYVVRESDFGGAKGIKSILNNYYEQEIAELDKAEQPLARKFIEEGLIVAGRRVGISEGVEEKTYGINNALLGKLLASRLIRAENTHLGRSYELSHDTLVAPILESYEIRRRVEEQAEQVAREKEREALLAVERKKRRRAMLLAAAGFFLFFLAAAGGFYAAKASIRAEKLRDEADQAKRFAIEQKKAAESALAQVEQAQLEMARANLENGKSNLDLGNYQVAIQNFSTVSELKANLTDSVSRANQGLFTQADQLKSTAVERGGLSNQFQNYMRLGEKALQAKQYEVAYSNFQKAKNLNASSTSDREATLKIGEVVNLLVPKFKSEISKAETFMRAGSCDRARRNIRNAESIQRLLPRNRIQQVDLNKLEQIKSSCR